MLFTVWVEADDRAESQDLVNSPDVPATVANAGVAFWNRRTLDPASAPLTAAAIRARNTGLATLR
jgi:hypothetical protein